MKCLAFFLGVVLLSLPAFAQEFCDKGNRQVSSLVGQFQELQKKRDPRGVLALMTPSRDEEEKLSHSSLLALDAFPDGTSARLYSTSTTNQRLLSFKIKEFSYFFSEGREFCAVLLEEQKLYPPVNASPPKNKRSVKIKESSILVFLKTSVGWQIDKYTKIGSPGKYSGRYF